MARKTAAQLEREIAEVLARGEYLDPKLTKAYARMIQRDTRADLQRRFPIGATVRVTNRPRMGEVTGHFVSLDQKVTPRIDVRFPDSSLIYRFDEDDVDVLPQKVRQRATKE